MCQTLDRVFTGEISRLIVNIPPGYTKTELAVIYFIARGLAINARARFIHASFNGQLALENSNKVRDVLSLSGFQEHWPRRIRNDTNAKGLWRTSEGGGLMAAAAGGPITGFRAGTMEPSFTGALIIDDPLKPDDAESDVERKNVNDRWHSTFKSRLALETVPVIVIMQRLHVGDFSGFLLKGGAGCRWHHLLLPIEMDRSAPYPSEFTHGDPIAHDLPDGPLWPVKHDAAAIELLKVNAYTFAGQYKQNPVVSGGNLFREEWLLPWTPGDLPQIRHRMIYVDTAEKTGQRNDFSVFQCWGLGADGRAYLLDQMRARFEAPELLQAARTFWKKHSNPALYELGYCLGMKVEDKSAGTGLLQSLRRPANDGSDMGPVPVISIPRSKDKQQRANDVLPSFAAGLVRLPAHEPWFDDWKSEVLAFPSGAHDDQVDPTMDAIADMLLGGTALSQWAKLGEDD